MAQNDIIVPKETANGTFDELILPDATTQARGLLSSADKTKLDGIASAATANSSDATLLARANHTGTQAHTTITGLGGAAVLNVGTTAGTVAAGDDARFTGFQPNPETLPDAQSGVLADGTLLPRVNAQHYQIGDAYGGTETVIHKNGPRWVYRATSCGSEDCYDYFYYESTNDAVYPWLATWPAGLNIIKGQLPRVGGAALSSTGNEGTSSYAARADHTHAFPTAQQVGAAPTVHSHSNATTAAAGFLSSEDKTKINASITTAYLNNTQIRQGWWSVPIAPNFAGRLIESRLPSLIINDVTSSPFIPAGFKNSYLFWKRGNEELVHAPTTPFYQGIGALSILRRYVSYDQIGTSPAGQPSSAAPQLRGGVVLIQGSTQTRSVRQFFTVSGQEYAYVIDYPETGNPASGPEQLELWTSSSGGFAYFSSSQRVISRVAVLGRTLDYSWQPTSGVHLPYFRIIQSNYDMEYGDHISTSVTAQSNGVTSGAVSDDGGSNFFPVWNLSWGSTTVRPADEMAFLEGPPGTNHSLVSLKTPFWSEGVAGSRLQWQPKDGRIFFANTAQNSVSAASSAGQPNESAVFIWRTTHADGVFSTGTLTLPNAADCEPGQRHLLTTLNAVTAFTLNANGNTVYGATPSSLSANQTLEWICVAAATWVLVPVAPHGHPASQISDSTAAGRTLLTAANAQAQRDALSSGAFTTLTASTSLTLGTSGILIGGTNLIEQRNGTSAQEFRIFNTFTSATNRENGFLRWSSNVFQIGTEKGTGSPGGTARALEFQTDGVTRCSISTTGAFSILGSGGSANQTYSQPFFGRLTYSITPASSGSEVKFASAGATSGAGRTYFIIGSSDGSSNTGNNLLFGINNGRAFLTNAVDFTTPSVLHLGGQGWGADGVLTLDGVVAGNTGVMVMRGLFEQRNGTSAQTFRIYNTVSGTGNVNFDRVNFRWASNEFIIDAEAGGTGTLRGIKIGSATSSLLGFYGVTPVDQPATVADPAGGGTQDAEARTAINAIIDRLQELGLIA